MEIQTLQLKNIKYLAARSEETHCFSSSLYVNERKVGTVGNSGHGASNDVRIDPKYLKRGLTEQLLNDFVLEVGGVDSSKEYIRNAAFEIWVGNEVNEWLANREYTKFTKSYVCFRTDDMKPGQWKQLKMTSTWTLDKCIEHIRSEHPGACILNQIERDEGRDNAVVAFHAANQPGKQKAEV